MSIFPMAVPTPGRRSIRENSWWLYLLLGIVLLIAGICVLGDVVLASVVSAIFIGWAIVIAGILEIVHAFSAREWKGFLLDLLLGILYIAGGWVLLSNPIAATVSLTLAVGVIWIVSGIFRIVLAGAIGREGGWGFSSRGFSQSSPERSSWHSGRRSGLWVLGLLLGIDLIVHGAAWIGYAFSVRSGGAEQPA